MKIRQFSADPTGTGLSSFHTLNKLNQFGRSVLLPEHGFIAYDQALDIGIVSGEVEGCCDLTLVSGIVGTDPGAKRDVKPEFSRNLWHPLEPLGGSIGAHRPGLPGDGGEISPNPRLGHFPSRRRRALETIVRNARQPVLDGCCRCRRIFQRPDRKMDASDQAENEGQRA